MSGNVGPRSCKDKQSSSCTVKRRDRESHVSSEVEQQDLAEQLGITPRFSAGAAATKDNRLRTIRRTCRRMTTLSVSQKLILGFATLVVLVAATGLVSFV